MFLTILLAAWLIAAATVGVVAGLIAVAVLGPRDRGRVIASALVSGVAVTLLLGSGNASIPMVTVVALAAALAAALVSRYISLSEPLDGEGTYADEPADAAGTIKALRQRVRRQRGGL